MDNLLDKIYLDGHTRAVLGSYALWRSRKNPNWTPNDCDVFIAAKNIDCFRVIVKEILIKLKQFGYTCTMVVDKRRVIDYRVPNIPQQLSFVFTNKNMDDTMKNFDISCCMYKMVSSEKIYCDEEIESLTSRGISYAYKDTNKKRLDKYIKRGFRIEIIDQEKPGNPYYGTIRENT
jgi:hypothetical protein